MSETTPATPAEQAPLAVPLAVLQEHVLRANRALRNVQVRLDLIARTIASLVSDTPGTPVPADWCADYRALRADEQYAAGVLNQAAARAQAAA